MNQASKSHDARQSTGTQAGILGIGVYVPETVRGNDWWPEHTVAKWRDRPLHKIENIAIPRTAGVEAALAAMNELRSDPFNGAVQRHVMGPNQTSSEMETEAARRALADAKVDPSEIDAVISYTMCPDYLAGPTGAIVHRNLGLPKRCFTISVDGACNAFPMQLTLADQAIRSGSAQRVLVITSSAFSKLVPLETSFSVWMGDGATATVLGPVSPGRGILSCAHGTEGEGHRAMVFGIPDKRWYDDGRVVCYLGDRSMAQSIILGAVDRCKDVVTEALGKLGMKPEDVDFYAGHQGGPWLRRVTQEFTGMHRARFLDTFKAFGNLGAANIPLMLSMASREGTLRDGDLVATFSAGTGQTYSSTVLRWGR
jgi:3-oxoacyl-[acyl-carrier-protein] synthase-3